MARYFFAVLGVPIAMMVLCFCIFMGFLHVRSDAASLPSGFAPWASFTLASAGVVAFAVRTWWLQRANPQADRFTVRLVPGLVGIGLLAGLGFVAAANRRLEAQRVAEATLFCQQNEASLRWSRTECLVRAGPCVARLGLGEPAGAVTRMAQVASCVGHWP